MNDLNKFEHSGQITEGCQSGQHLWDETEGHIGIEKDGDMTKIKIRCLVCGKQFDISAPLGLNEYIDQQNNHQHSTGVNRQYAPNIRANDDVEQSDILKRILG